MYSRLYQLAVAFGTAALAGCSSSPLKDGAVEQVPVPLTQDQVRSARAVSTLRDVSGALDGLFKQAELYKIRLKDCQDLGSKAFVSGLTQTHKSYAEAMLAQKKSGQITGDDYARQVRTVDTAVSDISRKRKIVLQICDGIYGP